MQKISENSPTVSTLANVTFLSVDEVIEIHDAQIKWHGGLRGIRDKGLLESALFAPQTTYNRIYLLEDIFHMAAAYAHSIIKNHPFVDGNKRTGITVSLIFLNTNDAKIEFQKNEIVELAQKIAASQISLKKLSVVLRQKSN